MSIHWPIIGRLLQYPLSTAIVDDRRSWRGIEILVAAMHLASELDRRCRTPTVGLLLPTNGVFPIAALAGWMLGKTVVPLNYLLKPAELRYVLEDCGTDTVVTTQGMLEFLGSAADESLFGTSGEGAAGKPAVANLIRMEDVSFTGMPEPRWPARAAPDEVAVLLYTSGTSGRPKGVMLTHRNLRSQIRQVMNWVDFTRRDTMLGVLPQFHSFGLAILTLLPMSVGIKVVYTARFVPHRLVKLLREHRPTVFVAIPSMYNALLAVKDAGPEDFESLRYVVSGGEPLPRTVAEKFRERFGVTINEGYGLTETSPATNWCRPHEYRPGSVGRPIPEVDQVIVDINTREPLPPNVDGEVLIKGPNVMPGYFNLEQQTRDMFDGDGYLKTGDMGRFDDEGHLYITGRLKEMLIVAGENVFPREIEEVLNKHPSVNASGVIGEHDPLRGELPVAFVELKDGEPFDEKSILMFCREHLAGYKVPSRVVRLDALPRNPTGKVMRRELKALLN